MERRTSGPALGFPVAVSVAEPTAEVAAILMRVRSSCASSEAAPPRPWPTARKKDARAVSDNFL